MKKDIFKTYLIVFTIVLVICLTAYASFNKPSITTATYEQLTDIPYIGHITAQDIIYYCDANKNASVEDLEYINGIGPDTIKVLLERWK